MNEFFTVLRRQLQAFVMDFRPIQLWLQLFDTLYEKRKTENAMLVIVEHC